MFSLPSFRGCDCDIMNCSTLMAVIRVGQVAMSHARCAQCLIARD